MVKPYVVVLAGLATPKCEGFRSKASALHAANSSAQRGATKAAVGPGTVNSESLTCNYFGQDCETVCLKAMAKIDLAPFPKDFFGGLSADDRVAGKDALEDVAGASLRYNRVYVKDQGSEFAVPFDMEAYFSCYTRSKWPLFNAWVVDPALQKSEGKIARTGSFKNPDDEGPSFQAFHEKYKNEYLRAGDVKGVWSDYFSFDQGHWAPDAPFRKKKSQVASTYYFINVSPQTACLNRQEWEHLESKVREWSVEVDDYVSVMAGPLEHLPKFFLDSPEKKQRWNELLDQWRAAGEVLMRGVEMSNGFKDPHWVEAIDASDSRRRRGVARSGGHCMLRGVEVPEVAGGVDKAELVDLKEIPVCEIPDVVDDLDDQALYLMTQAGKRGYRRGVRIPLGYWKIVSWPAPDSDSQLYCCWIMDQVGFVNTDSGSNCLDTVKESADILPPKTKFQYATREVCERLYNPRGSAQDTQDCDFKTAGIGWRGSYLLDEARSSGMSTGAMQRSNSAGSKESGAVRLPLQLTNVVLMLLLAAHGFVA